MLLRRSGWRLTNGGKEEGQGDEMGARLGVRRVKIGSLGMERGVAYEAWRTHTICSI